MARRVCTSRVIWRRVQSRPAPLRSSHHHATAGAGPAPLPRTDWRERRGEAGRHGRAAFKARGPALGRATRRRDGASGAGDWCQQVSGGHRVVEEP